jgi:bifunctional ADP-heptose synthase (sugar kinase/adenylyltransferase)
MSPHDLAHVLDGLGRPKILVLGDRGPDRAPGPCAVSLLGGLLADVTCAGSGAHDSAAEETLRIERIESLMPWHDALVIRDHGGACTLGVLRAALHAAGLVQLPAIVHPCVSRPLEDYRGATAITFNRVEAEAAASHSIKNPPDALAAGKQLCERIEAPMAFLTLDHEGIMLVEQTGYGEFFPAHARTHDHSRAAEVSLATIALCLAEGTTPEDAARLACVAVALGESLTRATLRGQIPAPQPAVLSIPDPSLRRAG